MKSALPAFTAFFLLSAALAATPCATFLDTPSDAAAVAWVRFVDASQDHLGTPYLYVGNRDLLLTFDVAPQAGDTLELLWGSKKDQRTATLIVNECRVEANGGGYQGFRWLRVPLPAGITGPKYTIRISKGQGQGNPAFLAEVRLVAAATAPGSRPDLKAPSHKGTLVAMETAEAFPHMRKSWDTEFPAASGLEPAFRQAEKNSRQANEAFYRSRRYIDGWLAYADPETGLIPRNLRESRDFWNGRDSAADNYPFMVLTAAMTDRPLMNGRLLDMLRTETRVTCRIDRLPDDYSFSKKGWRREKLELDAIIFDGSEYVKDGLLPITEWLGASPWSERATGIIDDVWKNAALDTPFGKIPTKNFEVNGDLLQACSRLFWFTGQRKYLDWAIRLGDYYLLGDQHPTRDLPELSLGDHSCEVINGLSELYVACAHAASEKREAYRKPLHELYDRLLVIARNEHGLLYLKVNTKTGEHSSALTDNWGYNYDGLYTAWLLDKTEAYRDAVRQALGNLKAHYTGKGGMCQSNTADGYADSIEGAITLFNREPVASAADWMDTEIKTMWGRQQADGVIEGWHGDGNSARTSLMYALWKTQGITIEPWRADVRFGAVLENEVLKIIVLADQPWEGRLIFDIPRHKTLLHLPLDYPRINQFPEWYTVEPERVYEVTAQSNATAIRTTGTDLRKGFPVQVKPGEPWSVTVRALEGK